MEIPALSCRYCLPLALSVLCCACSTPEERANEAFAELTAAVEVLRAELATITDAESAQRALPALEEQAENLRELLTHIDMLAEEPELTAEARHRVGETHHMPLRVATDAALKEVHRLARRALYHSDGLNRLARREYAHYSRKGIHPWARAVLAGREYHPAEKKKK